MYFNQSNIRRLRCVVSGLSLIFFASLIQPISAQPRSIFTISEVHRERQSQDSNEESIYRILFIGNSYIYVNNLPMMFTALAASGNHTVEADMAAEGGWTLAMHAASPKTQNMLYAKKWSYVVLQEQSLMPANELSCVQSMYPAARILVHSIFQHGAVPLLYVTWAHRKGWKKQGLFTAESMQTEIDKGYGTLSQEFHIPLVPVGDAWMAVSKLFPSIPLWKEDDSHPTEYGTYLAACVFYAAIFRESPEGLNYTAGLDAHLTKALQRMAAVTVLQYSIEGN